MAKRPAATNQAMEYLRVERTETVVASVLNKGMLGFTRLTRDTPNHGHVDQHVTEDAFMMSVQLADYHGDLWVDGRKVDFPISRKGNFTLYDYNRIWQADMKSAFDCVNIHIPRGALAALEEDLGGRKIETLDVTPGADIDDPTVRGLTGALLAALDKPEQASRLFVDQVGLALATHMAATYGEAAPKPAVHSGGLAPWQLKRAKALMDAELSGDLPVTVIAGTCGLSASYFTRAFKLSTGMPPYRWLLQRRIDKAMNLLKTSLLSLSDIAAACGFADQSHFTRTFSRAVGLSPGMWRKASRI